MTKLHFFKTINQLAHNDAVPFLVGLKNYIGWQMIRIMKQYPVEMRLSRSKIITERHNGVAALVKVFGMYDYNNMSLIQTLLTFFPDMVFVDVGANIGTYTVIAAETGAKVWAFEPHPLTFANLQKNVALNALDQVNCFNYAVSNSGGTVHFSDFAQSALNRIDENGVLSVICTTLDQMCEDRKFDKCIVKIDVEGNDFLVLQGFEKYFGCADVFFIETDQSPEIQQWMNTRGYQGPYYFHKNQDVLTVYPTRRKEDGIFFSEAFIQQLAEKKYHVPSL
ncbi:MAG TPA: hypothetical protein DCP32_07065 [Anaerolineaceae bacterium]|nr:hypothetical protein [Anaerolineaceae bacterium]HBA90744.1 hypothetical protein [Anaerolineaceae bacterium]